MAEEGATGNWVPHTTASADDDEAVRLSQPAVA